MVKMTTKQDGKSKAIGVALFGFGRMGRIRHGILATLHRVRLCYIVDEYPESVIAHLDAEGFDGVASVVRPTETKVVLEDLSVDAVFISVPTNLHVPLIKQALRAGKHVFVEKPVAATLEETRDCYEMADQFNRKLFCSFNRRFDPSYAKVRKVVATNQLGQLQLANMHIGDHPEPNIAVLGGLGSLILDMAPHGIDTLNWATGEKPMQVTTVANAKPAYQAVNTHDTLGMILKYPSGLIAYVNSCRYAPYGYDTRLEVIGTKGAIVAENIKPDNVIIRDEEGDRTSPMEYSFPQRYAAAFRNECVHFMDVLSGLCEMSVTKDDVLTTMATVAAAETSLKTGATVNLEL